jgi:hypothetical protein
MSTVPHRRSLRDGGDACRGQAVDRGLREPLSRSAFDDEARGRTGARARPRRISRRACSTCAKVLAPLAHRQVRRERRRARARALPGAQPESSKGAAAIGTRRRLMLC